MHVRIKDFKIKEKKKKNLYIVFHSGCISFIDQIFMSEFYLGYFQMGAFRSYFFITLIDSS